MRRFRRVAAVLLWDAVGLAGAASLVYGVWSIYPPAGFIAGGVLALAAAWLASPPAPKS